MKRWLLLAVALLALAAFAQTRIGGRGGASPRTTATAPLSVSAGDVSMTAASASTSGYLNLVAGKHVSDAGQVWNTNQSSIFNGPLYGAASLAVDGGANITGVVNVSGLVTAGGGFTGAGAAGITSGSGGMTAVGAGFNSTAGSGAFAYYTTTAGAKTCLSAGTVCHIASGGVTLFDSPVRATSVSATPSDGGTVGEFAVIHRAQFVASDGGSSPQRVLESGAATLSGSAIAVTFNTRFTGHVYCVCSHVAAVPLACGPTAAPTISGTTFAVATGAGDINYYCMGDL